METNKNSKNVSFVMKMAAGLILVLALSLAGGFGGVKTVSAAATVKLKNCKSVSSTEIAFTAVQSPAESGEWKIYRGTKNPSSGGSLKLLDSFPSSGNYWYTSSSTSSTTRYTYGNSSNVLCVKSSTSKTPVLSGTVTFYDLTASFGYEYYYQVQFQPYSGSALIKSNVVSAKIQLDAPYLTKSCSTDGKKVKLVWQSVSHAKGYKIYRNDGKSWRCIKTLKTTSYTDKSVKSGRTYRYKIRAYAAVNKKTVYSAYSSACKVSLKTPTVKGSYTRGSIYGSALTSSQLLQVRRVVQSFKDNYIKSEMSDYQKVLIAYNYLRANCTYARRGWQYNGANTAWGALVYGEAQCSGYARAMKALCDAIGVSCQYVHANSKAIIPSHQWNQVKVGGKWYILDAQGGAFLLGSKLWKSYGLTWNTSGLAKLSTSNHKNAFWGASEV